MNQIKGISSSGYYPTGHWGSGLRFFRQKKRQEMIQLTAIGSE